MSSGNEDEGEGELQQTIYQCTRPACGGRTFETVTERDKHREYHRKLRQKKKTDKAKKRTRQTSAASSTVGAGSLFTVRVPSPPPEDTSQKARENRSERNYKKNAPKVVGKKFPGS